MSATNLTKNLKLSQFVASDKPSWLGDVNGDNKKIDDGFGVLTGEISKANDTASSAKSQSDANTQTLTNVNSELEDYGNRITALEAGGGTEQLEQRVNTLTTDVESLQTRANTFEEKIDQNETNITNLTSRMTTVEEKAKNNQDNITSLQTTTQGLNDNLKSTNTVANNALNIANSANTMATTASNKADNATSLAQSALANSVMFANLKAYPSDTFANSLTIGDTNNLKGLYQISNNSASLLIMPFIFSNIGSMAITINSGAPFLTIKYNPNYTVNEGSIGVGNPIYFLRTSYSNTTSGNTLVAYAQNNAENHEIEIYTNTAFTVPATHSYMVNDFPTITFTK